MSTRHPPTALRGLALALVLLACDPALGQTQVREPRLVEVGPATVGARPVWRIRATDVAWSIDRETAALISLLDAYGHDWIGAEGGLPGRHAAIAGGTTVVEADQFAYARLRTRSADARREIIWEFLPGFARCYVVRHEGALAFAHVGRPPPGAFVLRQENETPLAPEASWSSTTATTRWIALVDPRRRRSLVFQFHRPPLASVSVIPSADGRVAVRYGLDLKGTTPDIPAAPVGFTLALLDDQTEWPQLASKILRLPMGEWCEAPTVVAPPRF